MAWVYPYVQIQKAKIVEEAYAETAPLLAQGRVEEARDLIVGKYRIGPPTRYMTSRPVAGFWVAKMGDIQVEYYAGRRRQTKGFFELQKLFALYNGLGELVRQFVMELEESKPDFLSRSLLHDAAYCQVTGICEFLLARGFDPNEVAEGNATCAAEALAGFENRPLSFDAEFDPFRVKELFQTLLDAGADPDLAAGTSTSVSARLRKLPRWYELLAASDEKTRGAWHVPDLEEKIPLLKSCYVDVLEARRLRRFGRK